MKNYITKPDIFTPISLLFLLVLNFYLSTKGIYPLANKIALYTVSVAFFSYYDILGYYHVLTHRETKQHVDMRTAAYRVMQGSFQVVLIVMLWQVDLTLAIAFVLTWWFGACDALYYLFRGVNFMRMGHMYWLWWTPYGLISRRLQYPRHLMLFSILSVVVSLIIIARW